METFNFLIFAKILALMFLFVFGACLVLSVWVQWAKDTRELEEWEQGEGETGNDSIEEEHEEE